MLSSEGEHRASGALHAIATCAVALSLVCAACKREEMTQDQEHPTSTKAEHPQ